MDVLTYHVVPGNVSSSQLTNGELVKTVEGKDVSVNIEGRSVYLNVGTNHAKVVFANVEARCGRALGPHTPSRDALVTSMCFIASQHTQNHLRLQQFTTPTLCVSSILPLFKIQSIAKSLNT